MNALKIVIISTFFLSTIGCNMNPTDVNNPSQEEISSYSGAKVFVSKYNYQNIKKFSWSSYSFINKFQNKCKSIARGKYTWRNSPYSNNTYVYKNSNWWHRPGHPGGVGDMAATYNGGTEYCYVISKSNNKIYESTNLSNFTLFNQNATASRIDVANKGHWVKIYIIGTDNQMYTYSYSRTDRSSIGPRKFNPVTSDNRSYVFTDLAVTPGASKIFAVSGGVLWWISTEPNSEWSDRGLPEVEAGLNNIRYVDVDKNNVVWVVRNSNSVYRWNGTKFVKAASNLAYDIAAEIHN